MSRYVSVSLDPHQREALDFLKTQPHSALFMDRGTGKTLVTIARIGRVFEKLKLKRYLIVCEKTMVGEWEKDFRHATYPRKILALSEMDGTAKKRRIEGFSQDSDCAYVLVVSYDTLRLHEAALARWKPQMMILDESHRIKNRTAKQTKAAIRLGKTAARRLILTGTPHHEKPLDLWAQFQFLDPQILGQTYREFQEQYATLDPWIPHKIRGYKNLDELARRIEPYCFFADQSVLKLPGETTQEVRVNLSPTESEHYREMLKEFLLEVERNQGEAVSVVAPNVLARLLKLQQIAGGAVIESETGEVIELGDSKLSATLFLVNGLVRKRPVVIFCRFTHELDRLSKKLTEASIRHSVLSGKTRHRSKVISEFQSPDGPDVIVIQINAGSSGITLTRANATVFYSFTHSFITFEQAKARVYRRGQPLPVTHYVILARDTVDEEIYQAVRGKHKVSSALTQIVRRMQTKKVQPTATKRSVTHAR